MKIAKLYDSISPEERCIITLDQTRLTIENINDGKQSVIEKQFDNEDEALKNYYTHLWEVVAKGYNQEGEPFKGVTTLFDPESDKSSVISVEDTTLTTENISKGKSKITEKTFESNEKAAKEYEKKVWAVLKKGWIARNENVQEGGAIIHRIVNKYYDGALSFENTPLGIFVYKAGENIGDASLLLLDMQGNLSDTIELPQGLAWSIQYHAPTNKLYLKLDQICTYDLAKKEFSTLLNIMDKPVRFLSVQSDFIAYGIHPDWVLEDKQGNGIHRQQFDVDILKGAFPFCASLSKKGDILAMSCKEGFIELLEATTGKSLKTIEADFPTVRQMEFVDDDRILVIQETHGKGRIRYFNTATDEELTFEGLELPAYSKNTTNFCFNVDESLMIQQNGWWMYVFDFKKKRHLYEFKLEHCGRFSRIKFIDYNTLGVSTDYGCFSLYKI